MPNEIVTALLDLFPDTVRLRNRAATSGFGNESWAAFVSPNPRARIVGKKMNIEGPNGQVIKSSMHVILAGVFDVTVLTEITLPARFLPRIPKIVAVRYSTDENGPHHETVYFA